MSPVLTQEGIAKLGSTRFGQLQPPPAPVLLHVRPLCVPEKNAQLDEGVVSHLLHLIDYVRACSAILDVVPPAHAAFRKKLCHATHGTLDRLVLPYMKHVEEKVAGAEIEPGGLEQTRDSLDIITHSLRERIETEHAGLDAHGFLGTSVFQVVIEYLAASRPLGREFLKPYQLEEQDPLWRRYFTHSASLSPNVFCIDEALRLVGATGAQWGTWALANQWEKGIRKARICESVSNTLKKVRRQVVELVTGDSLPQERVKDRPEGDRSWLLGHVRWNMPPGQILEASVGRTWWALDKHLEHKDQCAMCQCYYPDIDLVVANGTVPERLTKDRAVCDAVNTFKLLADDPARCAEADLLSRLYAIIERLAYPIDGLYTLLSFT